MAKDKKTGTKTTKRARAKPVAAAVAIGLTEDLPAGTEKSLAGIKLLETVDADVIRQLEDKCIWYFCPKGGHVFEREDTSGDVFFEV